MKKFMLIAALMVVALNVNAQNDELKNEIGISYGFGSTSNILSTYSQAFNFGSSDQSGFWGPVAIEYFYHVTPVIGLGAIATISGCSWEGSSGLSKNAKSTYFSFMPSVKFNWLRKDHFGMYSKVAVGLFYDHASRETDSQTNTDNKTTVAFQVSALGLEFGSQLRGFLELGIGEQGVLLAGLRYKF